jgi:hypothetical protein
MTPARVDTISKPLAQANTATVARIGSRRTSDTIKK